MEEEAEKQKNGRKHTMVMLTFSSTQMLKSAYAQIQERHTLTLPPPDTCLSGICLNLCISKIKTAAPQFPPRLVLIRVYA